ncbi:hypothetical protein DPMN_033157 [Dreissena polymorpha]|uniref:Uncharacterized protein n=1 Tax=Dreissena polymorpha TaxID=45954 RepID=A0A9D4M641_DREPO|nr:hypothetical protein DPMN_033157 [Dreissena polymorpha]
MERNTRNTPCVRQDPRTYSRATQPLEHHRTSRGQVSRLWRNINGQRKQDMVQREEFETSALLSSLGRR